MSVLQISASSCNLGGEIHVLVLWYFDDSIQVLKKIRRIFLVSSEQNSANVSPQIAVRFRFLVSRHLFLSSCSLRSSERMNPIISKIQIFVTSHLTYSMKGYSIAVVSTKTRLINLRVHFLGYSSYSYSTLGLTEYTEFQFQK